MFELLVRHFAPSFSFGWNPSALAQTNFYGLTKRALWGQWALVRKGEDLLPLGERHVAGTDGLRGNSALMIWFPWCFLANDLYKIKQQKQNTDEVRQMGFQEWMSLLKRIWVMKAQGVRLLEIWVQLSYFITESIKKLNPFLRNKLSVAIYSPLLLEAATLAERYTRLSKLPALQLAHLFCSKRFCWKFLSWKEEK